MNVCCVANPVTTSDVPKELPSNGNSDDLRDAPVPGEPALTISKKTSQLILRRLETLERPTEVQGVEAAVNVQVLELASGSSRPLDTQPSLVRLRSQRSHRGLSWTESRIQLQDEIKSLTELSRLESKADGKGEEQRLLERLSKLKLEVNVMAGDGNCQFRSLSWWLYGTAEHHMLVRRKAVEYMTEHRQEFEGFLGDGVEQYLASMVKDGFWGDELTLRAACNAYGVVVNVITSDQKHWFMRYSPPKLYIDSEVFVTYISPVHYNAIRRQPSPLRQALSKRLGSFKLSPS